MSEDTTYNGWTNYETWLANLWMDNGGLDWGARAEELAQEMIDREEDISELTGYLNTEIEEYIQENTPELPNGMYSDMLSASLRAVNTWEIAKHYAEDVDVWVAGWNMPGYMPDNAPALFVGWAAARDYLAGEMDECAEQCNKVEGAAPYEGAAEYLRTGLPGNAEYGQTIGAYHWFLVKGV